MIESHAAQLKLSIIKIDDQILELLLPHRELNEAELHKIAALEKARSAAHRLLTAGTSPD